VNLTTDAFRECVLAALEELEANSDPTEIRRVDTWVAKLTRDINNVKEDFGVDELGERDTDAEDISYEDVLDGLPEELSEG
jgi:hypothetical protein